MFDCNHIHNYTSTHTSLLPHTRTFSPFSVPRDVTFIVIDSLSAQSNPALARVNFEHLDSPPILDLNGVTTPGNNFTTQFREGDGLISVSGFPEVTTAH